MLFICGYTQAYALRGKGKTGKNIPVPIYLKKQSREIFWTREQRSCRGVEVTGKAGKWKVEGGR